MKAGTNFKRLRLGLNLLFQEKGLTLIEIVVSSVILAAVLIPLISTLVSSQSIVYMGRDYMVANNLIMQAAEKTKLTAFASISNETVPNYEGLKFTLTKNVIAINSTLKRVDLELKVGTKVMAKTSLIIYEKGI